MRLLGKVRVAEKKSHSQAAGLFFNYMLRKRIGCELMRKGFLSTMAAITQELDITDIQIIGCRILFLVRRFFKG